MKCVHCGRGVASNVLFKSYGPGSITLSRCTGCGQVADPYVEYDWVLVCLDLALLKPSAFRHVLCNDELSAARLLKFVSIVVLLETFVRAGRAALSPAEVLRAGYAVLVMLVLRVTCFALLLRTVSSAHLRTLASASCAATLLGSALPWAFNVLALIWDYSHLGSATALFFDALVSTSIGVALHASTGHRLIPMLALSSVVHWALFLAR